MGTVFFLGMPLGETDRHAVFAVTALHIVAKAESAGDDKCLYVRMNTMDGAFGFVKITPDDWERPDQSEIAVDVAVYRWPAGAVNVFLRWVGLNQCATADVIDAEGIGVGTDVFLPGLFVNHYGKKRNVPIVRMGNIAAMPEEPVRSKLGLMEAFLIEARSIGGLSGSPVFVNLGLAGPDERNNLRRRPDGSNIWFLLGVMHGHWDAVLDEAEVDDGISKEYVNMGVAIVTPISKALDLVETHPL